MGIRFVPGDRAAWLRFGALALIYTAVAIVLTATASRFDLPNGYAPWYPPAAAMLAYLLVTGWRGLPVAIAARVLAHAVARTDELTGSPALVISQAIAVSISYLVAAELLDRLGLLHARIREFGLFVVVGVVLGPLLASTSSAVLAAALGDSPWSDVPSIVNTFWVGDAVAVASIVPFIVFAANAVRHRVRLPLPVSLAVRVEFALQAMAVVLVPVMVFALDSTATIAPYLFLAAVPVVWMALRRNLVVATGGLLVTNTLVAAGARVRLGADADLLQVQMVMLAAAIAALYCAAIRRTYQLQQLELAEREERYHSLVDHSPDFITRVTAESVVFAHEPAGGEAVHSEVIDVVRRVAATLPDRPDASASREWHIDLPTATRWFDTRVVRERPVDPREPITFLGVTTDRTAIHLARQQLRARARHDRTTGLLNRVGFEEELERLLESARYDGNGNGDRDGVSGTRPDGDATAVELVTIRFTDLRSIAATHGTTIAEQALAEAVARVVAVTGHGDLVARIDPTALAIARARDGSTLATTLRAAVDEAVPGPAGPLYLGPYLGVSHVAVSDALGGRPGDHRLGTDPAASDVTIDGSSDPAAVTTLIEESLIAAEAARVARADAPLPYEPALRDRARTQHETVAGLRHAIDDGGLVLHFQPVIDVDRGVMVGAEALVRWRHPTRGLVMPEEFVALAERTGLIGALGRVVLDESLEQLARWQQQFGDDTFSLSVNVSARQLADPRFAQHVITKLHETGVAPRRLHLEVTETAALDNLAETGAVVAELHDLGIHFALDDFGTGYAAMSSLRDLPIDTIKIDKSFTEALPEPDALALVRMTVSIADELGLRVIAEGVETEEQQRILLELGCHLAQGWLYARALPADDLTARLDDGHDWVAAAG